MKKTKTLIIISTLILIVIGVSLGIAYMLGNQARNRLLEQQAQQNLAPAVAVKHQVKKITLKNTSPDREEVIEITGDGKITRYDKNGKLLKSGQQGFSTIRGLFEKIEYLLDTSQPIVIPGGYQIIIETNKGTITVDPVGGDSGGTIIDDIIDIVDQTLNPTPRPTITPFPGATPLPTLAPTPIPSVSPSPTPGQDYTQVTPFNCSDYYKSGKRLKISNIFCGETEINQ